MMKNYKHIQVNTKLNVIDNYDILDKHIDNFRSI